MRKNAFVEPRAIDMDLVVPSKLVCLGYIIRLFYFTASMEERLRKGLSAGRVQSVALKLIIDISKN